MSVIGSLDKQVEEIIIAPIAKRHERQDKAREDEQQSPPEENQHTATEKEQHK